MTRVLFFYVAIPNWLTVFCISSVFFSLSPYFSAVMYAHIIIFWAGQNCLSLLMCSYSNSKWANWHDKRQEFPFKRGIVYGDPDTNFCSNCFIRLNVLKSVVSSADFFFMFLKSFGSRTEWKMKTAIRKEKWDSIGNVCDKFKNSIRHPVKSTRIFVYRREWCVFSFSSVWQHFTNKYFHFSYHEIRTFSNWLGCRTLSPSPMQIGGRKCQLNWQARWCKPKCSLIKER